MGLYESHIAMYGKRCIVTYRRRILVFDKDKKKVKKMNKEHNVCLVSGRVPFVGQVDGQSLQNSFDIQDIPALDRLKELSLTMMRCQAEAISIILDYKRSDQKY